jgi:hypothetical protein
MSQSTEFSEQPEKTPSSTGAPGTDQEKVKPLKLLVPHGGAVTSFTEHELSARWKISVKTLQRWRLRNVGPKFMKLEGYAVRYRVPDIEAYEDSCM